MATKGKQETAPSTAVKTKRNITLNKIPGSSGSEPQIQQWKSGHSIGDDDLFIPTKAAQWCMKPENTDLSDCGAIMWAH